jgi:uracil-DNA glycosylase
VPDARRPLQDLNAEWENCIACELGERRKTLGGQFVAGEGTRNAIMFIGEGPGRVEEEQGRPFVGPSGELLRTIIRAYHITDYYITNIVPCRSCETVLDDAGQPRLRKIRGRPAEITYKDVPPLPNQLAACTARIYEEIYIVDPVIIVALGVTTASFLLKRAISINKERGQTDFCMIPGATARPVLTDTKQVWVRKVKGEYLAPIKQNEVRYLIMPTLHPAYVLRKENDHDRQSPWNQLASDIKFAADTYEKYMHEFYGREPLLEDKQLVEEEVMNGSHEEENNEG